MLSFVLFLGVSAGILHSQFDNYLYLWRIEYVLNAHESYQMCGIICTEKTRYIVLIFCDFRSYQKAGRNGVQEAVSSNSRHSDQTWPQSQRKTAGQFALRFLFMVLYDASKSPMLNHAVQHRAFAYRRSGPGQAAARRQAVSAFGGVHGA